MGITRPRDSIYWVPVFCLLAAIIYDTFKDRRWKTFIGLILMMIVGYQTTIAYAQKPEFTIGYREAARKIVNLNDKSPILYGCALDTGYFIFFVREFDTERERIVLRADKIFATSSLNRIIEEKISNKNDLYRKLDYLGIRYVVMEYYEIESNAYDILRDELATGDFELVEEITVKSSRPFIEDFYLKIYEYKNYKMPKEEAMLNMNIPLMGDRIKVRLGDLMKKK
jgi:hypothetical protein